MNGDDTSPHEMNGPAQEEVQAIWSQVIRDLQDQNSRVCFYPGPQGNEPDFEDFIEALPLIGNCNWLVYSEPRLTKIEVFRRIDWHRKNLQFFIQGLGFVTEIEIVNTNILPCVDREGLFRQPPASEWVSPADGHLLAPPAWPHEDRFWGEFCHLRVGNRKTHVLHIGIGGDAAWTCFLRSHAIHPVRIIANPPFTIQGDTRAAQDQRADDGTDWRFRREPD